MVPSKFYIKRENAYKDLLPEGLQIHNVFHASELKKHLGPNDVPTLGLPLVDSSGKIKVAHVMVLATRSVPRPPHPLSNSMDVLVGQYVPRRRHLGGCRLHEIHLSQLLPLDDPYQVSNSSSSGKRIFFRRGKLSGL